MYSAEYFGLAGDESYDAKSASKRAACTEHGLTLIELYAADLVDDARLAAKLL